MEQIEDTYSLACAFCGKINKYDGEDLYEQAGGKQQIKKKWCQECGEPLVKYCPNCNTGIFIEANLKDTAFFKINSTFDEPTPSELDSLIPKIKELAEDYKNIALKLNPDLFRKNQPEYLANIPKLNKKIGELKIAINQIKEFIQQNEPKFRAINLLDDVNKGLDKSQKKCEDIESSILQDKELVDEKMDKLLRKKELKVLSWENTFNQFITESEKYRKDQIQAELNSYTPGKERVRKYLLYDPSNYRIICPTCKTKIYSIEKFDFIFSQKEKTYKNTYNLNVLLGDSSESKIEEFSNTFTFKVTIYISKPGGDHFNINATMKFALNESEELVIGRNYIRDLNYEEPIAEDLLFDPEEDVLGMVSRNQLTIYRKDNKLFVKGLDYDPRRIGTFVNSLDNDIRQNFPTGIVIKKKDKIIVPITNESQNENRIELILQ